LHGYRLQTLDELRQVPDTVNASFTPADSEEFERVSVAAKAELLPLVRDILGNPFRRARVEPRWLTPTVVTLAQGIYEDRAFDRLPVLPDALQDAGCDDANVLVHCRGRGLHVRGCWVVDLFHPHCS
jgi:hypothetical protein